MNLQEDWFLKSITIYTDYLYTMVGQYAKKVTQEEFREKNDFELLLEGYIRADLINEGENFIFEYADPDKPEYLFSFLQFYLRILYYSDERLRELNFSREEIQEGLEEIAQIYGYPISEKESI